MPGLIDLHLVWGVASPGHAQHEHFVIQAHRYAYYFWVIVGRDVGLDAAQLNDMGAHHCVNVRKDLEVTLRILGHVTSFGFLAAACFLGAGSLVCSSPKLNRILLYQIHITFPMAGFHLVSRFGSFCCRGVVPFWGLA